MSRNELKACLYCENYKVPMIRIPKFSVAYAICERQLGGCGATGPVMGTSRKAVQAWNDPVREVREE